MLQVPMREHPNQASTKAVILVSDAMVARVYRTDGSTGGWPVEGHSVSPIVA